MERYELAFIVAADHTEEKREKIVDSIKSLVTTVKANPGELEAWGKREFTFPIAKKTEGVYYLLYFQAQPEVLADLERRLKINTDLIRYLIVRQKKTKVKRSNKTVRVQTT